MRHPPIQTDSQAMKALRKWRRVPKMNREVTIRYCRNWVVVALWVSGDKVAESVDRLFPNAVRSVLRESESKGN